MNTFTAPQNAQAVNIIGDVVVVSYNNSTLQSGSKINAGDQLSLAKGSEIVLIFEDGARQTLYGESDEITPEINDDIDALQALLSQGDAPTDTTSADVLNDIDAIQALIESGDDVIDLPATAAGGLVGNEGLDFITVDRSGTETQAKSGYDTTSFAPAADVITRIDNDFNANLDITAPTLTISNSTPNPLQNNESIITFQFSEDVTAFTQTDVSLTSGTLTDFTQIAGDTWTAIFTPDPMAQLAAEITVADNSYSDLTGTDGRG